ncbi:hypothetical protein JCM10207_005079 [Rhodosporidiobolus poonsookiae]
MSHWRDTHPNWRAQGQRPPQHWRWDEHGAGGYGPPSQGWGAPPGGPYGQHAAGPSSYGYPAAPYHSPPSSSFGHVNPHFQPAPAQPYAPHAPHAAYAQPWTPFPNPTAAPFRPTPPAEYRPHRSGEGYPHPRADGPSSSSYRPPYARDQPRRRSASPSRGSGGRSPSPAPYAAPPTGPRAMRQQDNNQGYTSHAPGQGLYSARGEYLPAQRRQKQHQRSLPVPVPTATYLSASERPSVTLIVAAGEGGAEPPADHPPPLVILDLNHTLLCRAKRTSWGSRQPLVRPYLSTFLSYLCSTYPAPLLPSSSSAAVAPARRPRFRPVVYSSARAANVLSMLCALSLIPPSRLPPSYSPSSPSSSAPYTPAAEQGDVLEVVFTREMMGLNKRDFSGDVETTKDLGKVWEGLGWGKVKPAEGEGEVEAGKEEEEERNPDEVYVADDSEGASDAEPAPQAKDGDEKASTAVPAKAKKPNRKAKARLAKERDETGAAVTLLLDDEASKAVQQPHNHLPIRPFLVHPNDFPAPVLAPPVASSSPSRSRSGSPRRTPPPPTVPAPAAPPPLAALELPASHPASEDTHLLGAIYQLDLLRWETNISSVMKEGFVERVREEARRALAGQGEDKEGGEGEKEVSEKQVDEELARRGRAVCERVGVEVRREWDREWRVKLLEKDGRAVKEQKEVEVEA